MAQRGVRGKRRDAANRIEEFAEDLGRLLGTATAKAETWLGQRKEIAARLAQIRDTAAKVLGDLGHGSNSGGRGQRTSASRSTADGAQAPRKRRRLSAKARKAISDAQKRRWAAVRAAKRPNKP